MSRSGNNPVIPPRPDVAYMSGGQGMPPPPPERTTSAAASQSKTPVRKEPPPIPPHPDSSTDWLDKEELRARELGEARARAAQMEKTMRWWSDCTANWREKWSKVRNERNKSRDECKQLRSKLEATAKEYCALKRERNELRAEVGSLRKALSQNPAGSSLTQAGTIVLTNSKDRSKDLPDVSVCSSESHRSMGSDQDLLQSANAEGGEIKQEPSTGHHGNVTGMGQEDFVSKLLSRKDKDNLSSSSSHSDKSDKRRTKRDVDGSSSTEDILVQQKMSALQLKLEETHKILLTEREEKGSLVKELESMQEDLVSLRAQHEELKVTNEAAVSQLSRVREEHAEQIGQVTSELADESSRTNSMDRRLADLRKELEKLQAENAQEWAKRERLETEKLSLEREVKKQKKEIEALQEEVEKRNRKVADVVDSDLKVSQVELLEKNRELSDLRHVHAKMKKMIMEKTAELDHAKSRAEQYETEVKKLRARIDELKGELASAEDEVDQQTHEVRKLQRNNDSLQQQVEGLNVQVQHLQTRLLRSKPSLAGSRTDSLKSLEGNESPAEGLTGDDTDDLEP